MKIYYIENNVDERGTHVIMGYYSTLEKAKEALKDCCDWYRSKGTGEIYEVELDAKHQYPELVYKN